MSGAQYNGPGLATRSSESRFLAEAGGLFALDGIERARLRTHRDGERPAGGIVGVHAGPGALGLGQVRGLQENKLRAYPARVIDAVAGDAGDDRARQVDHAGVGVDDGAAAAANGVKTILITQHDVAARVAGGVGVGEDQRVVDGPVDRSEEHTSELQSRPYLVC